MDLDPDTIAVLKELRGRQRKAPSVVQLDDSRNYLFIREDGQPVHPNDAGVPISVVSDRPGHANANITLGVYTHQLRGSQSKAANTVADLVRKAANQSMLADVGKTGPRQALQRQSKRMVYRDFEPRRLGSRYDRMPYPAKRSAARPRNPQEFP